MKQIIALSLGPFEGIPNSYQEKPLDVGNASSRLVEIISNTYTFLSLVGGIMFILYFAIGALNWVSSGGKQEQIEKAKKMMTDAAIGLIIIAVSYPIIYIISSVLGLNILHPEELIPQIGPT
ncbi:pilin [Patescibacteria group bacterium]|nr:pilin [Patescibacteria group bacterium]MBU1931495.1 pilin [Patescibacteria group bacterium]